jgi:2-dehydro-3-deoxygalactonokinase
MNPFCAAVDWGTSSFRLWLLDGDGAVLARRRSDEGMLAATTAGFETVLERHLAALGVEAHLPVVVCGMAGARQGWREAPYVDAPADLAQLPRLAIAVPGARRDVRILPGIAQREAARPDVMRGEETQLLGLAETGTSPALVCLPGTHCKWVELKDGRVEGFATFMTGELFSVIAKHSILRLAMGEDAAVRADSPAFADAVESAFAAPQEISARLFGLRAGQLLGYAQPDEAAARLSGLLIGLELAGATARLGRLGHVVLVATGDLAAAYARALEIVGASVEKADAETAVRRGLLRAARTIWDKPAAWSGSVAGGIKSGSQSS